MITFIADHIIIFQRRHNLIPFEGGFALLIMYNSIIGLLKFGVVQSIVSNLFGNAINIINNTVLLVAGLCLFLGVGLARRDLEAFGLIIIGACLVTRIILVISALGLEPVAINNYVFNTIFILACMIRLNTVLKKHIIIRLDDVPPIDALNYGKSIPIIH